MRTVSCGILAALLLAAAVPTVALTPDEAITRGWRLLEEGKPSEARRALEVAPPAGYDLGDCLVFLRGLALVGEGDLDGAAVAQVALKQGWPGSSYVVVLAHELAVAAALDGDLVSTRRWLTQSKGKVDGPAD